MNIMKKSLPLQGRLFDGVDKTLERPKVPKIKGAPVQHRQKAPTAKGTVAKH